MMTLASFLALRVFVRQVARMRMHSSYEAVSLSIANGERLRDLFFGHRSNLLTCSVVTMSLKHCSEER